MTRRLLNLLTALSLLLCIASLLGWLVSFVAPFEKVWETPQGQTRFLVMWGGCVVFRATGYPHRRFNERRDVEHLGDEHRWGNQNRNVFPGVTAYGGVSRTRWAQGMVRTRFWRVGVSLLWITVLSAILPLVKLARAAPWNKRRRKRTETNLCPRCGHDKGATGGQCPECRASSPDPVVK